MTTRFDTVHYFVDQYLCSAFGTICVIVKTVINSDLCLKSKKYLLSLCNCFTQSKFVFANWNILVARASVLSVLSDAVDSCLKQKLRNVYNKYYQYF